MGGAPSKDVRQADAAFHSRGAREAFGGAGLPVEPKGPAGGVPGAAHTTTAAYPGNPAYSPAGEPLAGEQLPLGYWIANHLWRQTRGSARLDFARPTYGDVRDESFVRGVGPAPFEHTDRRFRTSERYAVEGESGWLGEVLGRDPGTRVKILRHMDFGKPTRRQRVALPPPSHGKKAVGYAEAFSKPETVPTSGQSLSEAGAVGARVAARGLAHDMKVAQEAVEGKLRRSLLVKPEAPLLDLGLGLNFELARGWISPVVRLKVKDLVSLRLIPNPALRVSKRWKLGTYPVALRLKYECPLECLDRCFEPPARLMLRLESCSSRLFTLTPMGLELEENTLYLGYGSHLQAAASIGFPRELPLPEGAPVFHPRVHRLGVKAKW